MARSSKPRGRPARPLAPRIDATAEEVARFVLSKPPPGPEVKEQVYRCSMCKRPVYFPEILYNDSQCEECHREQP